jgi:hypothetical protein
MPKIEEAIEHQIVFGTANIGIGDGTIKLTDISNYPQDDGYPTHEQIKAMADEITYRSGKKLSEITKATQSEFPTVADLPIQKQFGTALKFDQNKLPLNLLSTEAMNQTAAVLAFGAEKYAEHNWRKGFAWSRPLAAAMRHLTAFNDGEDRDPESGLSHLAHAACCIMFLLEFEKTHPELDDRYKPNVPTIS